MARISLNTPRTKIVETMDGWGLSIGHYVTGGIFKKATQKTAKTALISALDAKERKKADDAFKEMEMSVGGDSLQSIGVLKIRNFISAAPKLLYSGSAMARIAAKVRATAIWSKLGEVYKRNVESMINKYSSVLMNPNPAEALNAISTFQAFVDQISAYNIGSMGYQSGYKAGRKLATDFIQKLKEYSVATKVQQQQQQQIIYEDYQEEAATKIPIAPILMAGAGALGLMLILKG